MSFETSHICAQPFGRAASLRGPLLPALAATGIGNTAVSGFLVWLKLWLAVASNCGFATRNAMRSETQRYIQNVLEGVLTDIFPHRRASNLESGSHLGFRRPPSLLPDSARAAIAPQVLCGRRRRRILARGIPASRRYDGLQYLNDRHLTGNQFLERACRLSVGGRVGIYGLEYRLRLCQRRHEICANPRTYNPVTPSCGPSRKRVSFGLSPFHLGPD